MLPLTTDENTISQIVEQCDGFLLTGGHDVEPSIYGEERTELCGAVCKERDSMEIEILKYALQQDKPILGICRGIQVLNVALGGTLYQDVNIQMPTEQTHHAIPATPDYLHDVSICEGTPLSGLLEKDVLRVNSRHHQGVKDLSEKLLPMAYAPDGLVEAVYMPDKTFVWGVQWHPEYLYEIDEDCRKIFQALVKSSNCK